MGKMHFFINFFQKYAPECPARPIIFYLFYNPNLFLSLITVLRPIWFSFAICLKDITIYLN